MIRSNWLSNQIPLGHSEWRRILEGNHQARPQAKQEDFKDFLKHLESSPLQDTQRHTQMIDWLEEAMHKGAATATP